jgi:hypothetical protein
MSGGRSRSLHGRLSGLTFRRDRRNGLIHTCQAHFAYACRHMKLTRCRSPRAGRGQLRASTGSVTGCRHQQTKPQSTMRSMPVHALEASQARKVAGPTSSLTSTMRPIGVCDSQSARMAAISGRCVMAVSV